jgi:hypothetical protein
MTLIDSIFDCVLASTNYKFFVKFSQSPCEKKNPYEKLHRKN